MKKILTTIIAAAILSTNLFANQNSWDFLEDDKTNFCKDLNDKNLTSLIKTDNNICKNSSDIAYRIAIKSTYDATNIIHSAERGNLSIDFLKQTGVGLKEAKNWGNLAVSYSKFICFLNEEEKAELMKFNLITVAKKGLASSHPKDYMFLIMKDYKNTIEFTNEQDFIESLADNDYLYDKEKVATFSKYIILEDFERAKNYIIEENNKRTNRYFKEAKEACNNKELKTVRDVYNSVIE